MTPEHETIEQRAARWKIERAARAEEQHRCIAFIEGEVSHDLTEFDLGLLRAVAIIKSLRLPEWP